MRNRLSIKNNPINQGVQFIKSITKHRESIVASFEDKVDSCRKNETSDLIDNAAWDHAVYLFEKLFDVAAEKKETVRLISGHLRNDFYSLLADKIKKCIDAGSKIEVIVLKNELVITENRFASLVDSYENGKIITLDKNETAEIPHMLLIGKEGQRFRLETDHQQTKAVASFNNPSMGKMLLKMYTNFIKNIRQPVPTH